MSIVFFLRTAKKNLKGEMPVCCSINVNSKQLTWSLGFKSSAECWDYSNSLASKKHKDYFVINNSIQTMLKRYEIIKNNLELENKKIDAFSFKALLIDGKKEVSYYVSFSYLFEKFLEYQKNRVEAGIVKISTLKQSKNYLNIFNAFLTTQKKNNIEELKRGDFEGLKLFCYSVKKHKTNTISKILSVCCGFLDWCVNNDYINKNTFKGLTLKKDKAKKIYLSVSELETLEKKVFDFERLEKIKDLFLFACYSGLSFSDLETFNKEHIKIEEGREVLVFDRNKTSSDVFVPLLDKAKKILLKYDYVLPVITNQKYNAYLKEIQTICKIQKHLTTHVARKTFINLMLNHYKVPAESVMVMVGHKSLKTTFEYYANIEEGRVLSDMKEIK